MKRPLEKQGPAQGIMFPQHINQYENTVEKEGGQYGPPQPPQQQGALVLCKC